MSDHNTQTEICPSTVELERLARGTVENQQALRLADHVAGCNLCESRFEVIQATDPLLCSLRENVPASTKEKHDLSDLMLRLGAMHPHVEPSSSQRDTRSTPRVTAGDTSPSPRLATPSRNAETYTDYPEHIGEYRVLGVLGSGGMSTVFRAADMRLKRLVALKLIRQDRTADRHYLARFEQEGTSIARLEHPNIVRVHEIGSFRDRPFLALELADGGSLADYLEGSPIPVRESAQMMKTISVALAYAHRKGVVHRDLKPANILLCSSTASAAWLERDAQRAVPNTPQAVQETRFLDGSGIDPREFSHPFDDRLADRLAGWGLSDYEPKIADFGLAKHLDDRGLTESGDLLGTPSYLAPELTRGIRGDRQSEKLGDVYSLGAILYELLTGRPPFLGATVADTFEQVRTLDPIPPRRLCPGVPKDIETICLKCLSKEPHRRYQSAQELAEDLNRFLDDQPIKARRIGPAGRLVKWAKRRPALAVLTLLTAAALCGSFGGAIVYELRLSSALEQANENAAEAERARDHADGAYQAAKETLEGMLKLIEDRSLSDIPRIKELQRRQMEEALGFYGLISTQQGDDARIQYDAARAAYEAGRLEDFLGRIDDARRNYQRAIDSLTILIAETPEDVAATTTLANSLIAISGLNLDLGEHQVAIQQAVHALETLKPFTVLSPVPEQIRSSLALAHHRLGTLYMTFSGQRPGFTGEEDLQKALEHTVVSHDLIQQLVADDPSDQARRNSLAKLQVNLSIMYQQMPAQFENCQLYHDLAEQTFTASLASDPFDISVASDLAILRVNWAFVQEERNELDQALLDLGEALTKLEELILIEPQYAPARDALYRAHGVKAQILDSMARFAESCSNWEGCVRYSPTPDALNAHRLSLANALVQSGNYQRGVAEMDAVIGMAPVSDNVSLLWMAATIVAKAVELAGADTNVEEQQRQQMLGQYASAADEILSKLQALAAEDEWDTWSTQLQVAPEFRALRELRAEK